MRHILLHHHILKNAGSSIEAALERHFKNKYTEFHAQDSISGRVYPEPLYSYLESNPEIRALSSYHFFGRDFNSDLENRLLVENEKKYFFHDCILLRHPISRLVSMYVYFRMRSRDHNPLSPAAHDLSLAEFLNFLIGYHPHFAINSQVTMFGCDDYGVPPSSENLERAIARLKKVTMLGTVEEYARSMVIAEYFLQPLFGAPQFHFPRHENVSDHAVLPGYDGSLESVKNIIGSRLFSELCDLNDLDIELCLAARKEVHRRSTYIRDFHLRMENFSKRCELASAAFEFEEKRAEQEALLSAPASEPRSTEAESTPKTPKVTKKKMESAESSQS